MFLFLLSELVIDDFQTILGFLTSLLYNGDQVRDSLLVTSR